ncbi:tetratricopeptide repeat protein [Maribacter algarum]|uniref:Tetratricopeptide repeat protein n=2 Tax=Maribacter algarum (ex Zhang et al. 2020) TaxID=2578118 RepID=A0A5S3PNY7_9FLAO|nr:tetratricopeptide repeat protein [Maribacter algarum]
MPLFDGGSYCGKNIIKTHMKKLGIVLLVLLVHSSCREAKKEEVTSAEPQIDFITPLGKEIILPEPYEKSLGQYTIAKEDYETNPDDVDKIIWYGRRTAYLGKYEDAIAIYTKGIKKFPKDAKLYRHRGHRYISLRKFDKAIADLEKAGQLIEGTENEIEPDGMPNAMNIPVSTLHGNIWYHLGLAYYLTHDYEKAFEAYTKCRASGKLPDNIVSSTHWLYMIQQRLGDSILATKMLEPIEVKMDVIENQSYHELCKLYKGLIPVDTLLQTKTGSPSNDAILYGIANWYFYNDDKEKAKEMMSSLVESKS